MNAQRDGRSRLSIRIVAAVATLALVSAACSSSESGSITYQDPDRRSLFELPASWNLYEGDHLAGVTVPFITQGADFQLPVLSQVAFDGAPSRDSDNLTGSISTAQFPVGSVTVREIGVDERDFISRFLLAELVVPYHSQLGSQELLKQDFSFDDDFRGVQLAVAYTDAVTEQEAAVYLISVTDPGVTKMYSIAVGCSLDCFGRNQTEILAIVDSYLVNTRG
ncbi:MAG: hypothetical protein ACE5MI_01420 [Acidimicrobiia bacterium]